jgi:AcrR family transcriptional regulator
MTETHPIAVPPEADETRQRLLDAAEAVFAEVGYEAATVRAICERAGVKNIGAVNYYFRGKENLYAEVVRAAFHCCSEGLPFPEWAPGTPAAQRLRDFVRVMVHRFLRAPRVSAMKLMSNEFADPSPACRAGVLERIQPMARMLHEIVAELLPDASEEQRWLTGFSIAGQCIYYRQNRAVAAILMGEETFARLEADRIAEHIADFSLAGLGVTNPSTRRGKGTDAARKRS